MGEVDVDEEIDEEGNVDEEEEGDAAVLCRNAQCLGSLLQSWVVESFLEVGLALRIYQNLFQENILYSKVAETKSVCHYYLNSRSCPYEKVVRSSFPS